MPRSVKENLSKAISQPRVRFEEFLDRCKNGEFAEETLGKTLSEAKEALSALFTSNKKAEALKGTETGVLSQLTARQYLIALFGLRADIDKVYSEEAESVKQVLYVSECALLRHLKLGTKGSLSSATQYTLRLSNIQSSSFVRGSLLKRKQDCLFEVLDFNEELKQAGVGFSVCVPTTDEMILDRYRKLPPAVKTLFFETGVEIGENTPFALVKELLTFADEKRWQTLCQEARQSSKAQFNKCLNRFVQDFIAKERTERNLKMGAKDVATDKVGNTIKTSHKGQALAQLCKPIKWVAKES